MNIVNKIYISIVGDNIHLKNLEPDVNEWKSFLESLPVPHNAIERAYNKYLCRQYFLGRKKRIIMDLAGLAMMIAELPFLLVSGKKRNTKITRSLVLEKHSEVGYEDVVPQELFGEYKKYRVIDKVDKKVGLISKESRSYLFRCISHYPFKFFFHYFVCKELIAHDYIINRFSPEAVAVYVNERNVASPILKEIYSAQNRRFISFMHGEYLLNMIQAYMSFTDYYVWDESYIDTFSGFLRTDISRFHVYKPLKLQKKWDLEKITPEYTFTYYFSNESKDAIKIIADTFSAFRRNGYKCKVRPHPRFMQNIQDMAGEFEGVLIETPSEITLEESLGNTEFVIGLATTVLFEAEIEGRKIVIDDISNKNLFDNLSARRFRLLSHEHLLLSELLKKYGD